MKEGLSLARVRKSHTKVFALITSPNEGGNWTTLVHLENAVKQIVHVYTAIRNIKS